MLLRSLTYSIRILLQPIWLYNLYMWLYTYFLFQWLIVILQYLFLFIPKTLLWIWDVTHYSSVIFFETNMLYRFARIFCNSHKWFPNSILDIFFGSYFLSLYILLWGSYLLCTRSLLLDILALLRLVDFSFLHKIVALLIILISLLFTAISIFLLLFSSTLNTLKLIYNI